MATLAEIPASGGRLSVRRCAGVGVVVFGVLFVLCWLGTAIGWLNASHMYLALFTIAPIGSTAAFAGGLCWSVVFGGLTGVLTAVTYNALAFLSR